MSCRVGTYKQTLEDGRQVTDYSLSFPMEVEVVKSNPPALAFPRTPPAPSPRPSPPKIADAVTLLSRAKKLCEQAGGLERLREFLKLQNQLGADLAALQESAGGP